MTITHQSLCAKGTTMTTDVRDHPNYQFPAFTVAEAEAYALTHQTVGAFRLLKALHKAEDRVQAAYDSASISKFTRELQDKHKLQDEQKGKNDTE